MTIVKDPIPAITEGTGTGAVRLMVDDATHKAVGEFITAEGVGKWLFYIYTAVNDRFVQMGVPRFDIDDEYGYAYIRASFKPGSNTRLLIITNHNRIEATAKTLNLSVAEFIRDTLERRALSASSRSAD